MKAKFITTFILGAVVGGLCVSLLSKGGEPAPDPAPQAKAAPPRINPDNDATKIARLEKKIAALEAESATVSVAESEEGKSSVVKVFGGDGASQIDFEEIRKQMEKGESERSEKLINSRLATLTSKLNLSEEQAKKVRELLEKDVASQGGGVAMLIESALAGGLQREDEPSDEFDFDAELDALLDDDQKTAYAEYVDVQNENYIEASANRQLAQLQTSVPDLTTEQKDRAYEEFARVARDDVETSGNPTRVGSNLDVARMSEQQKARKDAMKEILTPEQTDLYEAGNQNVITFGGGAGQIMSSDAVFSAPDIPLPAEAPPGDDDE